LETDPDPDDAVIADVAKQIVTEALQNGGRMSGFGIPAHHADPRSPALLQVAQETGAAGPYTRLLVAMGREVELAKGRPIPINLDGIVAALVLDFGFPAGCAAGFVMIPRSFSTLAHHLEEKTQDTRWRHVPQENVTYTGPMPAG
ncbi:MAG: citrate synthase, partial [Candidatus Poriferisodalaceae bacterium]